ncbi:hypothetical protein EB796_023393 [Bugula neritina]|uniref:ABC transmembrane type-1 domain-containing protein n=1 Tax=Bugula neritina TaxID=10212 RepID=A0A7J7IXP2_BUGNE|nr:hypothetical protein EB796_023393 [Bugula neritina]
MDFEEFCGSVFWDVNLTWNTPNNTLPDLTTCMENVCLVWAPCAFLWICLLPYFYSLKLNYRGRSSQPLTKFTIFKSMLPLLLVGLNAYDLVKFSPHPYQANFVSPILAIITLVCSATLVHLYRVYGQFTSGLLWSYTLLSSLTTLIRSYLYWKRFLLDGDEDSKVPMILYSCHFFLYTVGFILSSISDASAEVLERSQDTSPEVTASFPSYLVFHWLQPMMNAGYKKKQEGGGIERSDLYFLAPQDRVQFYFPKFMRQWSEAVDSWRQNKVVQKEVLNQMQSKHDETLQFKGPAQTDKNSSGSPSLVAVLLKNYLPILSLGWMFRLLAVLLAFTNPLLQNILIKYIESQTSACPDPLWKGLLYCGLLLISVIVNPLIYNLMFLTNLKAKLRIRSSLTSSIYRKALTMSGEAREDTATGEIVNLMSVDTCRTVCFVNEFWVFFTTPIQATVAIYLLYQLLGNSVFAALGIMLVTAPVSFGIAYFQRKHRMAAMKIKDERIKMINETLSSIKVCLISISFSIFSYREASSMFALFT